MVELPGTEWDTLGRLMSALGLMAIVAYLIPAMMSLSPQWERRTQIAATAFLAVALVLAIIASVLWFLR